MAQILIGPGAMPTTAAMATIATGTAIKTLMQLQPSATLMMKIIAWGISFDGSAAATPIKCELLETDVAATVTAYVAADLMKYDADALMSGTLTTNLIQVGTSNSGYNASAEGTITAIREFDFQLISPMGAYARDFPLGREPRLQIGKFARIRVTAGASVNAYPWMLVEL